MINPSEINPATLPSVALEDRAQLPEEPCIYFAIDSQDAVQYIGRSINPCQRWLQHHLYSTLSNLESAKIAYVDCPENLLGEVEEALIQYFDPPLNGSEDTRPRRDRGIKAESSLGKPSCIRWRLRQLMADRQVTNRALADALGIHETSVSNMKRRDDMPRVDGETLNIFAIR